MPEGYPLVVGIDETLEALRQEDRCQGRLPRSGAFHSRELREEQRPLRWVCAMLLVEIPWATRVWALPFLSALAPSERYAAKRGKRHKKITEWAWQLLLVLRRWYPEREIVAVADRAYASLKLLDRCRKLSKPITFVTRLRLDAALYEPAPARRPGQIGRPRLKGERLPNLSAAAEEPKTVWEPTKIANWYGSGERTVEIASTDGRVVLHGVARRARALGTGPRSPKRVQNPGPLVYRPRCRSAEDPPLVRDALAAGSDLQEMRRHLGFETQRQWSELAIRRTTPALLGLFSLVTLFAHQRMRQAAGTLRRQAAWYHKAHPTFSDALALVRKDLWVNATFYGSPSATDTVKVPRAFVERLTEAVCYAA